MTQEEINKTLSIPEDFPNPEGQTEDGRQKEFEAFTRLQNTFNLPATGTYAEQKKAVELAMLQDAYALDVELQTPESFNYLTSVIMEVHPAYRPLLEPIQKKLATLQKSSTSTTVM